MIKYGPRLDSGVILASATFKPHYSPSLSFISHSCGSACLFGSWPESTSLDIPSKITRRPWGPWLCEGLQTDKGNTQFTPHRLDSHEEIFFLSGRTVSSTPGVSGAAFWNAYKTWIYSNLWCPFAVAGNPQEPVANSLDTVQFLRDESTFLPALHPRALHHHKAPCLWTFIGTRRSAPLNNRPAGMTKHNSHCLHHFLK